MHRVGQTTLKSAKKDTGDKLDFLQISFFSQFSLVVDWHFDAIWCIENRLVKNWCIGLKQIE